MIIKYKNFTDGKHELVLSESAEKLGLDKRFTGDVDLQVKMDKSVNQIVLNCTSKVNVVLECDRCLAEFENKLTNDFSIVYMVSGEKRSEEEINVHYITSDEDKLRLAADVYDYVILSLPMKVLCREECAGLCPRCGKNLNLGKCSCDAEPVNPVWDRLKSLKNNLNNK